MRAERDKSFHIVVQGLHRVLSPPSPLPVEPGATAYIAIKKRLWAPSLESLISHVQYDL